MSSETYKSFDLIIRSDELHLKYFEKYYGSDNYDLLIKEDNNLDFKCFWSKSNYSDFLITENGVIVLIKDVGIFRIIEGKLLGIKGQYLLLEQDQVFNVRAHQGYLIDILI